jgi:hypothetical protein
LTPAVNQSPDNWIDYVAKLGMFHRVKVTFTAITDDKSLDINIGKQQDDTAS